MRLLAALILLALATQGGLAKAQTAQDLLYDGNIATKERRYVEAEAAYRKAIELDPNYAAAYNNLGKVLRDQKIYTAAEAAFRKAIELNPKYAFAYYHLGTTLKLQKKYVESEAMCRNASEIDQKFEAAYNCLGNALWLQKKFKEAELAYREAIKINPNYTVPVYNLANMLRNLKKDWRQKTLSLEHEVSSQVKHEELPTAKGLLEQVNRLLVEGRYMIAEEMSRKAIGLNATSAVAYYSLGSALWKQKKYVEAEKACRQAIELDPYFAPAYNCIGNILWLKGSVAEAEIDYRKAIKIDPSYAAAYNNLGAVLRDQKKNVEAEAAYRRAIELDPNFAIAYNNLGFLLQVPGRLKEARNLQQQAIKLDPAVKMARANLEEVERLIGIDAGNLKPLSPEEATRYLNPQDPFTPLRRSVVRILPIFSSQSSGFGTHGTGFVVRRQGDKAWILTARHVILSPDEARVAETIQVELYGGNLPAGILAPRLTARQVREGVGDEDLTLLEVDQLAEDILPLRFASGPVEYQGMPLTIVGNPGRSNFKIMTGTLIKAYKKKIFVDAEQMAGGGSGSPILNEKKEVIGMVYETNEVDDGIQQVVGYSHARLIDTLNLWGQYVRPQIPRQK